MARVLIAYSDDPHYSTQHGTNGRLIENQLKSLGYEVDVQILGADSATYTTLETDALGYDFVIVNEGTGIGSSSDMVLKLLGGSAIIPVFHLFNRQTGGFSYYGHGLSQGAVTTAAYKECTFNGNDIPLYTETRVISGQSVGNGPWSAADYDILITENVTGEIVAARYKGGAGSSVYVDAAGSSAGTTFLFMLQTAINNSECSPPPRKGLIMTDIDDMPNSTNTQSDIEGIYNMMETHGIKATWGIQADNLSDHPDSTWDYIIDRCVSNEGFIYPMENDQSWDASKSVIDGFYRANIANLQAKGFTTGKDTAGLDSYGYHGFQVNIITDGGLQLASTYNAEFCSVAGDTKTEGYGFRVVRTTVGNHSATNDQIWSPAEQNEMTIIRGIGVLQGGNQISSSDVSLDYSADVEEFAFQCMKLTINEGVAYNRIGYLHSSNFYDAHDGGNAPGLKVYDVIGDYVNFCSSVLKFAHPSELADRLGIGSTALDVDA